MQILSNNGYNQSFGAKLIILKDRLDMKALQKESVYRNEFQPYTNKAIKLVQPEWECTAKALGKESDVLEIRIHDEVREDKEVYYGQDNFYDSWSEFTAKFSATLKSEDKEVCSVSKIFKLPHIYSEPELHEIDEANGISQCIKALRNKYFENLQNAKIERRKEEKRLRRIELDKINKQREAEKKELKKQQKELNNIK